jgi:hypothetical protein
MSVWFRRALYVYFVVWALYFGLAIYLQRQVIGTPDFRPYATRVAWQTAMWPYVIVRVAMVGYAFKSPAAKPEPDFILPGQ